MLDNNELNKIFDDFVSQSKSETKNISFDELNEVIKNYKND